MYANLRRACHLGVPKVGGIRKTDLYDRRRSGVNRSPSHERDGRTIRHGRARSKRPARVHGGGGSGDNSGGGGGGGGRNGGSGVVTGRRRCAIMSRRENYGGGRTNGRTTWKTDENTTIENDFFRNWRVRKPPYGRTIRGSTTRVRTGRNARASTTRPCDWCETTARHSTTADGCYGGSDGVGCGPDRTGGPGERWWARGGGGLANERTAAIGDGGDEGSWCAAGRPRRWRRRCTTTVYCGVVRSQSPGNDAAANWAYTPVPVPSGWEADVSGVPSSHTHTPTRTDDPWTFVGAPRTTEWRAGGVMKKYKPQ